MPNKLTSREIIDLNKEYTFFSWSNQGQVNPIPMVRAEGPYFWDADGKRYLDFASQLVNTNVGHQHPKVIKAIQDQAAELTFAAPGMATQARGLLGKKLAEITPGDLKKTFFTLGGAEANENAIKIARFYTGRHKILARYRSYHGATHGAMALTGDYRRLPAEPAMSGVVHFLDPYCYRCPFGWTRETCHRECISHVEEVIQHEGPDQIAAIFLEGVTGTVESAKVRVYITNGTKNGPAIYATAADWTESAITWNHRPATLSGPLDDKARVARGWVEFDVTSWITGYGEFSFKLASTSADGVYLYARERSGYSPQLVVTLADVPTVLSVSAGPDRVAQEGGSLTFAGLTCAGQVPPRPRAHGRVPARRASGIRRGQRGTRLPLPGPAFPAARSFGGRPARQSRPAHRQG